MTEHADVTGQEMLDLYKKELDPEVLASVETHVGVVHGYTTWYAIPRSVEIGRHLKAIVEGKATKEQLRDETIRLAF